MLLGGLVAAGILVAGVVLALRRPPPAVLLLIDDPRSDWTGISREQRTGMLALVQDALEQDPTRTVVTEVPKVPGTPVPMEVLRLGAERRGHDLHFFLLREVPGEDPSSLRAFGSPREAMGRLMDALGTPRRGLDALIPEDAPDFWELADLMGPFTFPDLKRRQERAIRLAERLPGCAAAQFRAAYFSVRLLIVEATTVHDAQNRCDDYFQRALTLLPGYPRAQYQYVRFKTDVAANRDALDRAFAFRDAFPRHPLAHGALAYAARNAGLLEGALRALQDREALVGGALADPGLGENTYLYLGDLERFERSLIPADGAPFSALRLFYRGYVSLLRGDQEAALRHFREAQSRPGTVNQFEQLARVYELALLGERPAAVAALRDLRSSRTSLRIPDGEFTFKIAEAFAFLGEDGEAMESAARAFAQGFGCTRWYRDCPLFKSVAKTARWQALLQHLEERERLLARRYPLRRF